MPDPTNPAAPESFRPVTGRDVAREDYTALAKSIESNAAIHAAEARRRRDLAETFHDHGTNETELVSHAQPAAPAVDPREVCARVCEARHSTLTRTDEALEAIKCAAAIRALPPFAAQQPDGETHMHRMLSMTLTALQHPEIIREFGSAPEDVQGIIDEIAALHRKVRAAQQPSEAVRRYAELVDALIRRDEDKYVDWGHGGGLNECAHGISARFACQRCDYELIQSAIEERRSALAAVEGEARR